MHRERRYPVVDEAQQSGDKDLAFGEHEAKPGAVLKEGNEERVSSEYRPSDGVGGYPRR